MQAEAAAVLNRADPTAAALAMYVEAVTRRDYTAALTALDRSQPCGTAGCLKALALCWMGDARGAVAHAEQAVEMPALGPELAWRNYVTALANYVAGQYDDAVWWCRESARHHPGLAANARVLAASQAVLGRLDEALQVATQVLVIDPGFRIGVWRKRSLLPADCRDATAQRLRLAGLPA